MDKARRKIQYIFQDPQSSLNPVFTVFGSMNDVLRLRGVKKKKERRKIVGDLLEAVNMRRDQLDDYPHEFSGGQRQRIGIARALCVNPELVICDEAVSALDVSIQAQVLQLLKKFKEERNLTYIFVTHNLAVVEYVSDRIAVMYLGKVVELADTDDLFKNMFHPYTKALCSAIPVADINAKKNKIVLTGDVPNPANPPSGCPFHPRCLNCFEKCKTDVPKLRKYKVNGKDYFVACHLAHNQLKEKEIQEDLK
jgi:oligopeptide/dipeptide ABC transporter ATP-binding protein